MQAVCGWRAQIQATTVEVCVTSGEVISGKEKHELVNECNAGNNTMRSAERSTNENSHGRIVNVLAPDEIMTKPVQSVDRGEKSGLDLRGGC